MPGKTRIMPDKTIPPDWWPTIVAAAWSTLWAFIGRLLYVTNMVRTGRRRRFLTVQTAWELSVALGMGVVAGGLANYIGLTGLPAVGFISAASYLGPHAIEMGLGWMAQRAGAVSPCAAETPQEEVRS
jgi:hypothetical protein